MFKSTKTMAGFTLLELIAVIAIVAILALISVPIYENYLAKARFQNVISVATGYKAKVEQCIQSQGGLTGATVANCSQLAAPTAMPQFVDAVEITDGTGVIKVTAVNSLGLDAKTYEITPVLSNGLVTWTQSGTCQNSPALC